MALYNYLVTVKCVAPKNYRPRTSTYNIAVFSDKKNKKESFEAKAMQLIKDELAKNNPDVPIKITTTTTIKECVLVLNDDNLKQ
jgi:hypothetical protein